MLISILQNNILSYIIGNIIGLAKAIFQKEQPLWISKCYFKYRKKEEYLFTLIWSSFASILGFLLVISQEFFILPTIFLITGLLILIQFIHYFDKIYIFADRIEQRLFFYSHQTVSFDDIVLILRDEKTKQYADVIYRHPLQKFSSLDIGKDMPWDIPVEIFKNPNININKSKLYPNLFKKYDDIKESLPKNPIIVRRTDWSEKTNQEKLKIYLLFFSVVILNPYSLIVFFSIFFGFFYINPVFWISIDFSRLYSKIVYKKLVGNKTKLRKKYRDFIS